MTFLDELNNDWRFLTHDDTDSYIYLDNASTTFPKPPEVHEFMSRFFKRRGVSSGRACSGLAVPVNDLIAKTRKKLTTFFHADGDHSRMIFTYNATHSSNIALYGLLSTGDHVIASCLDHNAILRPLHHLKRDQGVEVDFIPFDDRGIINLELLERAIRANTKLISVIHGSNVLGTIQPIAEISRIAKKHDVTLMTDVSQTAGVIPIDIMEMGIDILIFPGHKSLLGPTGIGGLYVREGIPMKTWQQGGTGIRSQDEFHLEDYPYHLEAGTNNILGIAGLFAGLLFIEEKGIHEIHRREMALYRRLLSGIEDVPNVITYCAKGLDNHLPLLSFNIKGLSAEETGKILSDDFAISSRPGLHCAPKVHKTLGTFDAGTVRLSVGYFNTEADIDKAVDSIKRIAG